MQGIIIIKRNDDDVTNTNNGSNVNNMTIETPKLGVSTF